MYYIKICITVCVPSHGFVNVKQNLKLLKRSLKYFLSLFILKQTGQVGKGRERERERERERRERIPSRFCAVISEPDVGLELMKP